MSLQAVDIPKLQSKLKLWEHKKAIWLEKTGTTFVDHFDKDLYEKGLIAKQKNNGLPRG